jgi:hypothetical protein
MPSVKLALAGGLAAVALAGCGAIDVKPSSVRMAGGPVSRGRVDSPSSNKPDHVACLRAHRVPVQVLSSTHLVADGAQVVFEPTPGVAQGDQIEDREQGAEVIGAALLYPGRTPDRALQTIENCLAQGVSG